MEGWAEKTLWRRRGWNSSFFTEPVSEAMRSPSCSRRHELNEGSWQRWERLREWEETAANNHRTIEYWKSEMGNRTEIGSSAIWTGDRERAKVSQDEEAWRDARARDRNWRQITEKKGSLKSYKKRKNAGFSLWIFCLFYTNEMLFLNWTHIQGNLSLSTVLNENWLWQKVMMMMATIKAATGPEKSSSVDVQKNWFDSDTSAGCQA